MMSVPFSSQAPRRPASITTLPEAAVPPKSSVDREELPRDRVLPAPRDWLILFKASVPPLNVMSVTDPSAFSRARFSVPESSVTSPPM